MRITKTVAGDQARALEAALRGEGIEVKHTKAMDLVCAAHGLRSRQVLAAGPEGSPRPHPFLHDVARRSARRDEDRYRRLLLGTTAVTHPTVEVEVERREAPLAIPATAFDDVEGFASSGGLAAIAAELATGYFFERYRQENRGPIGLREGNRLGRELVEAARGGWAEMVPEAVLEEALGYDHYDGSDAIGDQGLGPIEEVAEAISEAGAAHGREAEAGEWVDALRGAVAEALEEADESKGSDALWDGDLCEVFFQFGDPDLTWDDAAASSTEPWSAPSAMLVDDALRGGLAGLGWTVGDFRKAYGNVVEGPRMRRRPRVRADRLVDERDLGTLIENACSRYFTFGLYAMVPVKQLLDLDLSRPLRFSRAAVSVWNMASGTFFDVRTIEDVVVEPRSGRLEVCRGYTPDQVCDFVHSAYRADIGNVGEPA